MLLSGLLGVLLSGLLGVLLPGVLGSLGKLEESSPTLLLFETLDEAFKPKVIPKVAIVATEKMENPMKYFFKPFINMRHLLYI